MHILVLSYHEERRARAALHSMTRENEAVDKS